MSETPGSYIVNPSAACADVRAACGGRCYVRTQPNGLGLIVLDDCQIGAVRRNGKPVLYSGVTVAPADVQVVARAVLRWQGRA